MMTCLAVFFVFFLITKYTKIDGNDETLSIFFWNLASRHSNQKQKRWRCFANNRAWVVEKSAVKADIQLEKDHKLLTFVYPWQNKLIKYKLNSETLCTFVIAKQSDWSRKISLAIKRQITQEDINLLLTKTTAARSSQEAVMTSQCS